MYPHYLLRQGEHDEVHQVKPVMGPGIGRRPSLYLSRSMTISFSIMISLSADLLDMERSYRERPFVSSDRSEVRSCSRS